MQPQVSYLSSNTDLTKMPSYNWDRFTDDNKVSNAPCSVGTVIITSNGQGVTDIILYDGESADDPVLAELKGPDNTSKMIHFQPPLVTHRGLYLVVGNNVTSVLIQYERTKETA